MSDVRGLAVAGSPSTRHDNLLDSDALDFIERDRIRAPIVKARGLRIGMAGHALRVFKPGVRV